MWRILQVCGCSGPTGTFGNSVPPINLEPRSDGWNRLDFTVVFFGIIDLILSVMG